MTMEGLPVRSIFMISLAFFLLAAPVSASDVKHVEDATLRSAFFIDHKEGWVVGDEGVILHTLNGGQTWHRQPTGLCSSLRSVHFLTPDIGWVVGREELPYGMGSVGVVLFTSDGGLQWKEQRQLAKVLPGLNQVRFVDAKTGFMMGDGSEQFPFGVFKSTDSGRSWEPVPGPRTTSWLAGDFYDRQSGIFAGAWSRLATVRKDKTKLDEQATGILVGAWSRQDALNKDKTAFADQTDWLAGRDITGLQILPRKTLAVGQGGLLLSSVKGGASWGLPQKILPADVQANFDFHSLYAVKDKVWVVGRPGSVVLHSADAGTSWTLHKTGQALPLHSVFFFDEKTGWAVGDAGTILNSTDGGKTWTTQHQAGKRAAAMTIHSLNKNAPVDTLALLGAADGYLTTSLRITAPDASAIAWGRSLDERRYAAAMRLAGGVTGETLWHFPMPQHLEGCDKKTILAHWNQVHANRAEEELIRQLVLSLRIWRPSILVSEHPDSKIPLSSLLGEAVQEAVRRAADAKAFPEQLGELGLEPWSVHKIYGLGEGKGAALPQDNDEPNERLQASARDYAATAHALLVDRYSPLPKQRTHHLLTGGAGKTTAERHWLEGLEQKVGESKRDVKLGGNTDVNGMQALVARRAVIEMADNLDDPARTLKLVPIALDKLDDEQAAPAAFTIAGRYAERGQWYLAQEVYLYLVDRFPAHPLSAEAYRWLIRLNTSSEARRRHELQHFAVTEPIGLLKKNGCPLTKEEIVKAGHIVSPGKDIQQKSDVRDWNKGSLELIKRLGGYGPVYSFDPATQFCLQAAKRQLGDTAASNDFMTRFGKLVPTGPWHDAARAERWLTDRSLPTPHRLARTRYTEVRPFLDGKFDDPCWKDYKPLVLDNAVGDTKKAYATEAMFAYDQEFLYVALKCTHPVGQQVAPVKPRPRDADVDAFDRVSILLDLDRDRSTYYHLEVDQRGCVRDSCSGDRNWNPRWFVAVHSTDDCWQIEAAIPLGELVRVPITQQSAWAFNVVRIMPGRGVQSWSQPADVQPRPEGMSLLLFQTGKARPMPMQPAR
jgi:photosystem II stability/assembly factor-like uncharacterized protein